MHLPHLPQSGEADIGVALTPVVSGGFLVALSLLLISVRNGPVVEAIQWGLSVVAIDQTWVRIFNAGLALSVTSLVRWSGAVRLLLREASSCGAKTHVPLEKRMEMRLESCG